ncbi:MAG: acyltransferase family protein [Acutalibacteraceae bacterium]|nr:acyltransferase family protein [Acutalibacteraceae bacterium]
MLLLLLVYFAVCVYGVKWEFSGNADYLSIENTQAIKGIFIIMVFFSHIEDYVHIGDSLPDMAYTKFLTIIGQGMVTLFMFYSGYGVMESIKKKGAPYVSKIPKNRILSTLFRFDLAVLLFGIITVALGEKVTLKRVLLSLIGWDALGNSNWYIFVILVLYLLTFIVFTVLRNKPYVFSVAVLSAVLCVLVFVTHRYSIRPVWWYDTALCYAFGMIYSFAKPKVEKLFTKNVLLWGAAIIVLLGAFYVLKWDHPLLDVIANLLFTAAVVLFTMHITLKNKILVWCGENLFELYILQRIPMILLKHFGINEISAVLCAVLSAVITVLLAIVFKKYSNKLWKALAK